MIAIAGRVRFDFEADGDSLYRFASPAPAKTLGRARFSSSDAASLALSDGSEAASTILFVGEARIDNRDEVAARLSIASRSSGESDAFLLFRAWDEYGAAALDWIRGDYAFAVWNQQRGELVLARGPLSGNQLFYCAGRSAVGFASTPRAALDAAGVSPALDQPSAAQFVAGVPGPRRATFYSEVERLPHAHLARITRDRIEVRPFWKPERRASPKLSDEQWVQLLLDRFDGAVEAPLRRTDGVVGAHLSSGRDSGAVATSAALQLARVDRPLAAFTAAPAAGFEPSSLPGRIDDESGLAARTAALYPNIRHQIVRPAGDPFAGLDALHAILPNPVGHLSNFPWWRGIELAAQAAGVSVLLVGNVGNFTVSAGGSFYLPSLLREDGARAWLRAVGALKPGLSGVPAILNRSFGGQLPPWAHRAILRGAGRAVVDPISLRLLREEHRADVRALALSEICDQRPPSDPFAFRSAMIMDQDPTNAPSTMLHGFGVRDPTGDRDFIDFCFTIPARLLVGPELASPLFERAFASRLGWSGSRPRGYQGADWELHFGRERVAHAFADYRAHPMVKEMLDFDYIDLMLREWPERWSGAGPMLHYRNDLLGALAAAHFIATNF